MKKYYVTMSVALFVFHLLVVYPTSHENKRLESLYRSLERKHQVALRKLRIYDKLKSDWVQKKEARHDIDIILPDEGASLGNLLAVLSKNAGQSQIEYRMNHHRPAATVDKGFYQEEYYGISLEGDLVNIQRFIRCLSESPRIIDVVEWSLFLNSVEPNAYYSELIIKTLCFLEPEQNPRKGKKGKRVRKTP